VNAKERVTYSNSSNDLLQAVQGPCQRRGIQCTDVTEGGQPKEAAAPDQFIGKRILFRCK